MVVATYFCYEKVRRTMRTAIISNLLNWRTFWITHLLDNLLFWGVVTTPQIPKIKSFAKIVFSNRSVLLQSALSYMFAWVLATPLLLIFLISFEELNTLVFWNLWDIWKSNLFFSWLKTLLQKRQHKTRLLRAVLPFPWFKLNLLIYGRFLDLTSLTCISPLLI